MKQRRAGKLWNWYYATPRNRASCDDYGQRKWGAVTEQEEAALASLLGSITDNMGKL